MLIIGCDFHPKFQQIAYINTETGEYGERRLLHMQEAKLFYESLREQQVRIGVEATGNYHWFQRLLSSLDHQLLLGDPSKIHASSPRKQRTDKRDARHILELLMEDRFPAIWQPPLENIEIRHLLRHRDWLVRLRTKVRNRLDSLAKNEGMLAARIWCAKHRQQIEALPLSGWQQQRRQDLFTLLEHLEQRITPLEEAVKQAAEQNSEASLLMTHPGVGPIVSLAYVQILGDWRRFQRGKNVSSYLGLIPSEESSADKRRLGKISKQGNTLLRWLLVQAASRAQRFDADWHRIYLRLSLNKHHGVAKVAIAHKLAVRLYWMLRSGQTYEQIKERGSHAGQSAQPSGAA